MTREEIYEAWAPPHGIWSPWAKPVLFAHCGGEITQPVELFGTDVSWAPAADGQTALVLDVPGPMSALMGVELASKGYRPVPLYNACPSPDVTGTESPIGAVAAVNLAPVIDILEGAVPVLRSLNLPPSAPPAFLLDALRRYGTGVVLGPGMFDNRSVSLPTDFPSANFMLAQGIRRVLLVQHDTLEPQEDLAHTLLRWQHAGIEIRAITLLAPSSQKSIEVRKPNEFRLFFQRVVAAVGLRRNPLGGFGGVLPEPSSGHGGIG